MALQSFFIGPNFAGSRTIPSYRIVPGLETRWHYSYAHYCARCGEIWARILHEQSPLTQLTHTLCAAHGDGRISAYPTWTDVPTRAEADWPEAALLYEFLRTLEWFERTFS